MLKIVILGIETDIEICAFFMMMDGWSSAPHVLLTSGRVEASHPDLATDPLGILHPTSRLCHQLQLVSFLLCPMSQTNMSVKVDERHLVTSTPS